MEMDIYYYCTYSRSPVGYVLGTLAYHPNQKTNYELKEKKFEPLLRKCFEQGRVEKGFGLLPNSSQYFVLVKSLDAEGTTDEDADYNMNIAFITKDKATYRNLLQEGNTKEQEIADAIRDSMEIDRKSDFGFTVRPKKLDELLGKSFRSLFDEEVVCHALESDEPYMYLGLLSSKTDLDDLSRTLGLIDQEKVMKRVPKLWTPNWKKWVSYGKKKPILQRILNGIKKNWKIIILLIAVSGLVIKMMRLKK